MRPTTGVTIGIDVAPKISIFSVIWPSVADEQSPRRCCLALRVWEWSTTNKACQELEDTIDSVLVLGVPFPCGNGLLPEQVVGLLERGKVGRNGLLLTPDSIDTLHNRPHVYRIHLALASLD